MGWGPRQVEVVAARDCQHSNISMKWSAYLRIHPPFAFGPAWVWFGLQTSTSTCSILTPPHQPCKQDSKQATHGNL